MTWFQRRMTISTLLLLISFGAALALATWPAQDPDMYWHLAMARQQWVEGSRWTVDSFSHTIRGTEWNNAFWLGHYPFYALYLWLGDAGLTLYTVVLAGLGMLFLALNSEGNPAIRAVSLILGALTSAVAWTARPHMISFTLTALLLLLLKRYREGRISHLWWLIPIFALWPNLHGGYALGFAALAMVLLGEGIHWLTDAVIQPQDPGPTLHKAGHIALVGLASAAATVIFNPNGFEAISYPFALMLGDATRSYIVEWQSPDFGYVQAIPQLLLTLATLAALGLSHERADWGDLLLVLGFTYLSYTAWRVAQLYPLVMVPLLVRHASNWFESLGLELHWDRPARGVRLWLNSALALIILAVTGWMMADRLNPQEAEATLRATYPAEAVDWLRAHPQPRELFNNYTWGGYIIWTLPEMPVFVDGRTDLYGAGILGEYRQIHDASEGWEAALAARGINTVLVENNSPIALALADLPEQWALVHEDETAVVLVRLESVQPPQGGAGESMP